MNKPISAKCYSSIMRDLAQISLILRRLRKYNCKNRGGVDREVSRRERHFPVLSHRPTHHLLDYGNPFFSPNHQTGKSLLEKKVLQPFFKFTLRIVIDPHPPLFFSSHRPNSPLVLPHRTKSLEAPIPNRPSTILSRSYLGPIE